MPLPQGKYYTYADYLTWDEQEHTELIEGTPVMMSPPSRAHQKACGEISGRSRTIWMGKSARFMLRRLLSVCLRSRTVML